VGSGRDALSELLIGKARPTAGTVRLAVYRHSWIACLTL